MKKARSLSEKKLKAIYKCFLESDGVAFQSALVKPGDIYFGLRKFEAEGFKKIFWRIWAFLEVHSRYFLHRITSAIKSFPFLNKIALKLDEALKHQFNGSAYAEEAIRTGASYAIVDTHKYRGSQYIFVRDVQNAFYALTRYHREQLRIPVIGITGSCGKTTTRELVQSVLNTKFNTVTTQGTYNTEVGTCLTLLSAKEKADFAIIEMGSDGKDSIREKARIAKPTAGLITVIGKAHLQGFGDLDGVTRIKRQLFDEIKANNGIFFLNRDDSRIVSIAGDYTNTISYGTHPDALITGRCISGNGHFLKISWKLNSAAFGHESGLEYAIQTKLFGDYNLTNILAAVAIGLNYGISAEAICHAIESYQPLNHRSQVRTFGSTTLIIDAYNANPTSMSASLANFGRLEAKNKILILGDMLELGVHSEKEHKEILALTETMHISRKILIGSEFRNACMGQTTDLFETVDDFMRAFSIADFSGATILIKGSNGINLERLVYEIDWTQCR